MNLTEDVKCVKKNQLYLYQVRLWTASEGSRALAGNGTCRRSRKFNVSMYLNVTAPTARERALPERTGPNGILRREYVCRHFRCVAEGIAQCALVFGHKTGYKELYNLAEKNYCSQDIKNNCWKEIAKQMGQSMTDCKERWSRLRDNYRKALKLLKTKSADAASKVRPCKFQKELSFLNKYLPDREQKTNIEPVCLVNSPAATEEEATDPVEATSNTNDLESLGEASASTNTIFGTTPTSLPNKKKKRTPNMQPHYVASVLEKYLETTTATTSTNNSLKQFFNAIYKTCSIHKTYKFHSHNTYDLLNNNGYFLCICNHPFHKKCNQRDRHQHLLLDHQN
ncbi:hypothetical protein HUJ04_001424 [Dendroctonus ponderosae]|nr:hypothetical protein HUJ04_001424 [Dendroctonus ponderosae]